MTFYTYAYIQSQAQLNDVLQFAISFAILLALLLVGIKYFRNRQSSKYRDLSIMLLLGVLFLLGANWDEFSRSQHNQEDSSHMVELMNTLSRNLRVPTDEIAVNGTQMKNGLMVKINNEIFRVEFNPDFSAYSLRRIYLIHDDIRIVDKKS